MGVLSPFTQCKDGGRTGCNNNLDGEKDERGYKLLLYHMSKMIMYRRKE